MFLKSLSIATIGAIFSLPSWSSDKIIEWNDIKVMAGHGLGNGGDVTVCYPSEENHLEGKYALDFIAFHERIDEIGPVVDLKSSLDRIEKLIGKLYPNWLKNFKHFRHYLFQDDFNAPRVWDKTPYRLVDIKDEDIWKEVLPENCRKLNREKKLQFIQAVIRRFDTNFNALIYEYDYNIVEDFRENKPLQLSFLIIHEFLRDFKLSPSAIRNINFLLHSNRSDHLSDEEFRKFLKLNRFDVVVYPHPTPESKKLLAYYPTYLQNRGHEWSLQRMEGFLKGGADPNATDIETWKQVHVKAKQYDLKNVRQAINYLTSVHTRGFLRHWSDRNTPKTHHSYEVVPGVRIAHIAAALGDRQLINLLVAYGADLRLKDWEGRTVVHYALSGGHLDLARYLEETVSNFFIGTDVTRNLVTYLILATQDQRTLDYLEELGFRVSRHPFIDQIFFSAIYSNNLNAAKFVRQYNPNINRFYEDRFAIVKRKKFGRDNMVVAGYKLDEVNAFVAAALYGTRETYDWLLSLPELDLNKSTFQTTVLNSYHSRTKIKYYYCQTFQENSLGIVNNYLEYFPKDKSLLETKRILENMGIPNLSKAQERKKKCKGFYGVSLANPLPKLHIETH